MVKPEGAGGAIGYINLPAVKEWPAIRRARLLLMPSVRHEGAHLRARAALAAAVNAPRPHRLGLLALASTSARITMRRTADVENAC